MTHPLPGGGVSRVHGAWSPVPPRLPLLATHQSVHHVAAVAAGAKPPRCPPNAWSPGVPVLPGPCYWLVASGTPLGWHGGCLAVGLVRGVVRHYCFGGCSALVVCARGRCRVCVFPVSPIPPRVSRPVCGVPSCPGVPYPRWLVRHSMRSVRSAGSVRLPFWCSPRVLCVCVRSRSRGVRAPPLLPGSMWRAHLAQSRCWAPVRPLHAVCAPPRVLPRSCARSGLPWGGGAVLFPSCLACGCVPPLGRASASGAFWRRGGGGGGGGCLPSSTEVRPRGPEGRGVALPRSVRLPSLGKQQSSCHWRRSGH